MDPYQELSIRSSENDPEKSYSAIPPVWGYVTGMCQYREGHSSSANIQ